MTASKRLDTPFKRVSLLVFIAGIAMLALSLALCGWENRDRRILYTKDHFGWAPTSNATVGGNVERYWSIDLECVAPFEQALIERAEQELENHLADPPKPPISSAPSSENAQRRSLSSEWREDAAGVEAYLSWSARREQLERRVATARDDGRMIRQGEYFWGVHQSDLRFFSKSLDGDVRAVLGVPEGEIREFFGVREGQIRSNLDSIRNPLGWLMPHVRPREETRSAERTFEDVLDANLGLSRFPVKQRRELFIDCVRTGHVELVVDHQTYHSDLVLFPDRSRTFLLAGLTMAFVGYLGSFGYRGSSRGLAATVGRLFSWIKNG